MNSLNSSILNSFLTTTAFAFLTTSCLSPVALAGNSEERETLLPTLPSPTLKRDAEEDKNSSKRTKLSVSEEFDVGQALITLPETAIYALSTFLSPAECFNLALTCKDLGKHLPHLPMWQGLIERSIKMSSPNAPNGLKFNSTFFRFQSMLDNNVNAKYHYANWLLTHNLNRRFAKRALSEILELTPDPQIVTSSIGLMIDFDIYIEETFRDAFEQIPPQFGSGIPRFVKSMMILNEPDEWDIQEVRAAYNLLVAVSQNYLLVTANQNSSSLALKIVAARKASGDYHRSKSRYYEFIKEELLPDQEAYTLLVQLSQNNYLAPPLRDQVNFRRAQMRFQNRIGDDRLSLSDAYDLFTQVSQSPTFRKKWKVIANSCRARMRLKEYIGDDRLTLLDAYHLLDEIRKDNSHSYLRRYAGGLRATMRFQNRIGDDLLTLCKAYNLWEDHYRDASISPRYYSDCAIEYNEIVDSSVIYPMLLEASQNPELNLMEKAEIDFYRARMRVFYQDIEDGHLPAQEAYQILLATSQNPEFPIERTEVDLCRVYMRAHSLVGDECLTVQEAYRMLGKIRAEDEDEIRCIEAVNLQSEMISNNEIGPSLLNSGDITPWHAHMKEWYTGPQPQLSAAVPPEW